MINSANNIIYIKVVIIKQLAKLNFPKLFTNIVIIYMKKAAESGSSRQQQTAAGSGMQRQAAADSGRQRQTAASNCNF